MTGARTDLVLLKHTGLGGALQRNMVQKSVNSLAGKKEMAPSQMRMLGLEDFPRTLSLP